MSSKEPMTGEEFGALIRRLRKERSLSMEGLARAADLSLGYIQTIEKGTRHPSLSSMKALARAMGLSVRDLLGGHEESYSEEVKEFARSFDQLPEGVREAILTLLRQPSRRPPPKPPRDCA